MMRACISHCDSLSFLPSNIAHVLTNSLLARYVVAWQTFRSVTGATTAEATCTNTSESARRRLSGSGVVAMAITATFDTDDDLAEFVLSTQPGTINATDDDTTDDDVGSSAFKTLFAQEIAPEVQKSTGETVVVTGVTTTVITLTTSALSDSVNASTSFSVANRIAITIRMVTPVSTAATSPSHTTTPAQQDNSLLVLWIGLGVLGGVAAIAFTALIIVIARKRCSHRKVYPGRKPNSTFEIKSIASLKSVAHRIKVKPIQPFTVTRYTSSDIF